MPLRPPAEAEDAPMAVEPAVAADRRHGKRQDTGAAGGGSGEVGEVAPGSATKAQECLAPRKGRRRKGPLLD